MDTYHSTRCLSTPNEGISSSTKILIITENVQIDEAKRKSELFKYTGFILLKTAQEACVTKLFPAGIEFFLLRIELLLIISN